MKVAKSFAKVTPFSKFLAGALFIILPFVGFFLGVQYQKMVTPSFPPTQYVHTPHDGLIPPQEIKKTVTPGQESNEKLCTMEAKQCPDGSYVGRSGLNCEFAACPK